jgi:Flp pilus assembly protein TadB
MAGRGAYKMNPTIKKILLAGGLGVIAWLFVMFFFYTVTMLIGWIIFAIILLCAYALWNKHARTELMKKEENFDILKPDKE